MNIYDANIYIYISAGRSTTSAMVPSSAAAGVEQGVAVINGQPQAFGFQTPKSSSHLRDAKKPPVGEFQGFFLVGKMP